MSKYNFNYTYLNKKIKQHLKYYDLDLEDLAISIGMTKNTLLKTLNNDRDFYVSEIFKISEVLRLNDKERLKYHYHNGA